VALDNDGKIEYMQNLYDSLDTPKLNEKDERGKNVRERGMISEWLVGLRESNFDTLTEPQKQDLQSPPFNVGVDHADFGKKRTAKTVSTRRELLEEFQDIYGLGTIQQLARAVDCVETFLPWVLPLHKTFVHSVIMPNLEVRRKNGREF